MPILHRTSRRLEEWRLIRPLSQIVCLAMVIALSLGVSQLNADDATTRYFEQLRQRGLFSLAESEAASRLSQGNSDFETQTQMSIELSRTLTEHAGFVPDSQRDELWQRAAGVVESLAAKYRSNPRSWLLIEQSGAVFAMKADWLRAEREIRLFDDRLSNDARTACETAIRRLPELEALLNGPSQESTSKRTASSNSNLAGHEKRSLLHRTRWLLALTYRNRAELSESVSSARRADLAEAEQIAKRLSEIADEPMQTQSRLLIVSCRRLRNEYTKAQELLNTIKKSLPEGFDSVHDQFTAERVQLLLDQNEPAEAAELLLKSRSERKRLSGQLWYLQIKALTGLRDVAVDKKDEALASRLTEQIGSTINRCDNQVGGFWARRSRQFWENTATTQKYGEQLDTLMQQARAAYAAGQFDTSIEKYASAEQLAKREEKIDIAAELGFTRGSILLEQHHYETANLAFAQVAADYPKQSRAAKSDLLATYCLGRLYDSEVTEGRLTAYKTALDHHVTQYAQSDTANEAYFLLGQLEEQQSHPELAIPYYLKVNPKHGRYAEAMAAVARCDEVILQQAIDRHQDIDRFASEAIRQLSHFLDSSDASIEHLSNAHVEVALRLASILLTVAGQQFESDSRDEVRSRQDMSPPAVHCQQAESRLKQVQLYARRSDRDSPADEVKQQFRTRIAPLMILALVGQGNLAEAEQSLKTLELSSTDRLLFLVRLVRFASSKTSEDQMALSVIQLKAATPLVSQRNDLSPADQMQLDLTLLQIYRSAKEPSKAKDVANQLMSKYAKNPEVQRDLALEFSKPSDPDAWPMAKKCWRNVESVAKPGTDTWFQARIEVIKACIRLKEFDEARKLLQITKVLHPQLGGPERKTAFDALEQQLQQRK